MVLPMRIVEESGVITWDTKWVSKDEMTGCYHIEGACRCPGTRQRASASSHTKRRQATLSTVEILTCLLCKTFVDQYKRASTRYHMRYAKFPQGPSNGM